MERIRAFWNRGFGEKIVVVAVGLLIPLCVIQVVFSPRRPAQRNAAPTTAPAVAAVPTEALRATAEPAPTAISEPTEAPAAAPEPTAPLSPVEQVRGVIEATLGRSNRDVERVITVALDPDQAEPQIFVRWNINDNVTDRLRSSSAQRDVTKILQAVAESGVGYSGILVEGVFPLVDRLGNTIDDAVVVRGLYPRATVEKINWANFLPKNVYDIGENVEVHQALRPE